MLVCLRIPLNLSFYLPFHPFFPSYTLSSCATIHLAHQCHIDLCPMFLCHLVMYADYSVHIILLCLITIYPAYVFHSTGHAVQRIKVVLRMTFYPEIVYLRALLLVRLPDTRRSEFASGLKDIVGSIKRSHKLAAYEAMPSFNQVLMFKL